MSTRTVSRNKTPRDKTNLSHNILGAAATINNGDDIANLQFLRE